MSALKNGALYIRVSTADQTELSPDAQQRLLLGLREEERDCHRKRVHLRGIRLRPACGPAAEVSGDDRACQTGVPPDRRDPGLEIQPVCP